MPSSRLRPSTTSAKMGFSQRGVSPVEYCGLVENPKPAWFMSRGASIALDQTRHRRGRAKEGRRRREGCCDLLHFLLLQAALPPPATSPLPAMCTSDDEFHQLLVCSSAWLHQCHTCSRVIFVTERANTNRSRSRISPVMLIRTCGRRGPIEHSVRRHAYYLECIPLPSA